ncbi:MAG: hypothetical protein IPO78_09235 [Saprospiraceae bacterium]|nr:hypothetical protein [Saprospiraceae bacterium]MBK8450072.1 hypothetical protein [Saprospiraceae bacterium]MBK8483833.1 hypothetical protein [Saprospiraceae bacterium]MBK9221285.1 hypothetical protein [Saprospiraceae bacterium]MBK9721780.1 hypothetical protein [Saprospiraceae bacterium]
MSKDKGTKNLKKAPADRSSGKSKVVSDYKSESKGGHGKSPVIDSFIAKNDQKSGGKKS